MEQPRSQGSPGIDPGSFTADPVYTDPKVDVKGHQALNDMIGTVQAQTLKQHSGFSFARTSQIDEHHRWIRFNWVLKGSDGETVLSGIDVAELDESGRLRLIVGFFGDSPVAS